MKRLYILGLLAFACLGASAQNLNPQVQVTNDYLANISAKNKGTLDMLVPDSLTNFKTKVDYSVFSTDYKGAYEFTPYDIRVVPEARAFQGTKLYLRAGAGYPVHPLLQAVVTPIPRGLFRYDIYQNLYGYVGDYSSVVDSRDDYKGYDLLENIGVEGRVNEEKFDLKADINYKGIYTKDDILRSGYHNVSASARVTNNEEAPSIFYDFRAKIGYAADVFTNDAPYDNTGEFGIKAAATLIPEIYKPFKFAIDSRVETSLYSHTQFGSLWLFDLNPKLIFDHDFLHVKAGASVTFGDGIGVYPDVVISANIIDNRLGVYLAATGGETMNDYSFFKNKNHWFNPGYTDNFHTLKEQINARVGFRGSIASHLQYDINGGYAVYKDAPMDRLITCVVDDKLFDQAITFTDYNTWFGNASLTWKSDRLDVNGDVQLRFTDIEENGDFLAVPTFRGNFSAVYNWQHRAFAGVRCVAVSRVPYLKANIKPTQDIGLYGEYRFVNKLAVWGQVGNLLNQKIFASPMHVTRGINFTAGICLRIQ